MINLTTRLHGWLMRLLIALTILAWLTLALMSVWLLGHVPDAVLVFAIGTVLAFAIDPLVRFLNRWMPRGLAVTTAYVLGVAIVFGSITAFATTASGQLTSMLQDLPASLQTAEHNLSPFLLKVLSPIGVTAADIHHAFESILATAQGMNRWASGDMMAAAQGGFNIALKAVLAFILSIYLSFNGHAIKEWICRSGSMDGTQRMRGIIETSIRVVHGYIRGSILMALFIGVLVGGGMLVLGVRYALLLGVFAFFMEFIPFVGVIVSGAACVLVALGQGWMVTLLVVIYFAIVHILEGDVVGPRVMGHAVGIHPALALLAFVAGTQLLGIWGALFAAPAAGLVQVVVVSLWTSLRQARSQSESPSPELAIRRIAIE